MAHRSGGCVVKRFCGSGRLTVGARWRWLGGQTRKAFVSCGPSGGPESSNAAAGGGRVSSLTIRKGRRGGGRAVASSAMSDRTLVLLKPDTVERGLVGEVLRRFESKGLTIVALDLRT